MDLERIKSLIDAMSTSDLGEMEFSEGGWSLRLVRGAGTARDAAPAHTAPGVRRKSVARPATAPIAPAQAAAFANHIQAPMFGVVHLRPAPDAPDFVAPGQAVRAGTILCTVEAMKVFNEVRATRDGIIAEILIGAGDEVEVGQILMRFQ